MLFGRDRSPPEHLPHLLIAHDDVAFVLDQTKQFSTRCLLGHALRSVKQFMENLREYGFRRRLLRREITHRAVKGVVIWQRRFQTRDNFLWIGCSNNRPICPFGLATQATQEALDVHIIKVSQTL